MLRRWFEDMSTYTWFAAALFVLGSGFILADLQSPSLLQWTGTQVADVQKGGIAYYSFKGVEYTLDLPVRAPGQSAMPSTVVLDPENPSQAMFSRPLSNGSKPRLSSVPMRHRCWCSPLALLADRGGDA